ncbi:MAG: hypothetical protein LIO70_09070 [Clostridiales bacterium]|nr:hypothetical protein [Clostridiales bacterium]
MEVYVPEDGVEVTSIFIGKDVPGQLYVPDKLQTKNKCAYFSVAASPCA